MKNEYSVQSTQYAVRFALLVAAALVAAHALADDGATLARDGQPQLPIVYGKHQAPAAELKVYLDRITGGEFKLQPAPHDGPAIFVGTAAEFPQSKVADATKLGPEGFVLATKGDSIYLLGHGPLGVQHAATTFLQRLGCRWFFPGETWAVVPLRKEMVVTLDERSSPSFSTQRRIWYGFGAYGPCKDDWDAWNRANRMGGPLDVSIGHSWAGLNPEKDFEVHPEWFALANGQRQPAKPCYSHPEVLARAKQMGARGRRARREDDQPHSARRPRLLHVRKVPRRRRCERILRRQRFVLRQELARRVGECHVGNGFPLGQRSGHGGRRKISRRARRLLRLQCLLASAVVRVAPECLSANDNRLSPHAALAGRTAQGVRRQDAAARHPRVLQRVSMGLGLPRSGQANARPIADRPKILPRRRRDGDQRGSVEQLGGARAGLLHRRAADVERRCRRACARERFLPASVRLRRAGDGSLLRALVRLKRRRAARRCRRLARKANLFREEQAQRRSTARRLSRSRRGVKARRRRRANSPRIDHLRMYQHYLLLRWQLEQAAATGDAEKIRAAIGEETMFGAKLTYTNMLHTRPLLGKAFERRFRSHIELLKDHPDAAPNGPWRTIGAPPTSEEIDRLWAEGKKQLFQ